MSESVSQSFLRHPFTTLLGSQGNVKVLRVLARHGGPLSVSRLTAETRMTGPGVRAVLETLVARHIVRALGSGRSRLYEVRSDHPLSAALSALFEAEDGRWQQILQGLRQAIRGDDRIQAAWLYGSVARGEDGPDSDVDVLVVTGKGLVERVAEDVRERMRHLGRTHELAVSVVVHTPHELAGLAARDDAWWANVRQDGRVLIGPPANQFVVSGGRPR